MASITCPTDTPGAVSSRVARPPAKLDDGHLGHDQVDAPHRCQWQTTFLEDLRLALGGVLHGHDHPLGAGTRGPSRRPSPAPSFPESSSWRAVLVRRPARPPRTVISRWPPRIRRKRHGTVEGCVRPAVRSPDGPPASVRVGCAIPSSGNRAGTDQPILRLEEHIHAVGNEVCHEGRNADAEIDEHSRTQFARDALGNDGLRIHWFTYWRQDNRPARQGVTT